MKYFDKENIYPTIRDIDISEELTEFYQIRKHYLIFTEAGKPVYTRYGDEMTIAPFFSTMSAIIPKVQSYYWNNNMNARDQTNKLRWINSENFICAILRKGNFFYICLTNTCTGKYLDDSSKKQKKISRVKESSSFIKK